MGTLKLDTTNASILDTYVDATVPATAYGSAPSIKAGNYTTRYGLLSFPLSRIPNDVQIVNATLTLYKDGVSTGTVNLHEVTSEWDEQTTWNTKPTFNSIASSSVVTPTTDKALITVDVKNTVQKWVNGEIDNFGWAFTSIDNTSLSIHSCNTAAAAMHRPSLTIEYSEETENKKYVKFINSSTAAKEITIPTDAQVGDMLVAYIQSANSSPVSPTPPEGWTILALNKGGSTNFQYLTIMCKRMVEGELTRGVPEASGIDVAAYRDVKEAIFLTAKENSGLGAVHHSGVLSDIPLKSYLAGYMVSKISELYTPPKDFIQQRGLPGYLSTMPVLIGGYTHRIKNSPGYTIRSQGTSNTTIGTVALVPTLNEAPTISLETENNKTLYESDILTVNGSALDRDNGNIVIVRYQINAGTVRAITPGMSDGVTLIPFNKLLTFKSGKLYDGATEISPNLAEGTAHTLKVWAEDDQGGKSVVEERTFFVVPNRAPTLSINPVGEYTDLINNDTLTITGAAVDPDDNNVKVSYKINKGLPTEILAGPAAAFEFKVKLSELEVGENIVIVEVVDSYNFKTSKTIKLNKSENLTPLLKSTQRYEIVPPAGSAKGVLLWVQRDKDLTVNASLSMTGAGEQEVYQPLILSNTAPVNQRIDEDEYILEAVDPKEKIILKLELSRASAAVNPAITLISGVLS